MFPDVDGQQRHAFGLRGLALLVVITFSLPASSTSHAQPLPKRAVAAVANSFLQAATLPNEASIFASTRREAATPWSHAAPVKL